MNPYNISIHGVLQKLLMDKVALWSSLLVIFMLLKKKIVLDDITEKILQRKAKIKDFVL